MNRFNAAQQIMVAVFGVPLQNMYAHYAGKTAQPCKSGPGRKHAQGDGTHSELTVKQRKAGSYGRGLRNHITRKQAAALA